MKLHFSTAYLLSKGWIYKSTHLTGKHFEHQIWTKLCWKGQNCECTWNLKISMMPEYDYINYIEIMDIYDFEDGEINAGYVGGCSEIEDFETLCKMLEIPV